MLAWGKGVALASALVSTGLVLLTVTVSLSQSKVAFPTVVGRGSGTTGSGASGLRIFVRLGGAHGVLQNSAMTLVPSLMIWRVLKALRTKKVGGLNVGLDVFKVCDFADESGTLVPNVKHPKRVHRLMELDMIKQIWTKYGLNFNDFDGLGKGYGFDLLG